MDLICTHYEDTMLKIEVEHSNILTPTKKPSDRLNEASSSWVKVFEFFIFLYMLFVYSYRLQKAKFKVGEWALFLR